MRIFDEVSEFTKEMLDMLTKRLDLKGWPTRDSAAPEEDG